MGWANIKSFMGSKNATGQISTIAGGIVDAAGKYSEGITNADANNYMAQISNMEARDARRAGVRAVTQHTADVKQFIGAQKAAAAGSGTGVNTGSNVDIIAESARGGSVDAAAIRYNAEAEAIKDLNQGRMYRAAAKNPKFAGILGAGASLLTTSRQFADKYYNLTGK